MRQLFILAMILFALVASQTSCRTYQQCGCASSSETYSEIQDETRGAALASCPSGLCPLTQGAAEEVRTAERPIYPDPVRIPPAPIADPL